MDILYNKKAAVISSAVMILFSIFVFGGNDLKTMMKAAETSFYETSEVNLVSIDKEMKEITSNAKNLIVVANRNLKDDNQVVKNVSARIEEIESEKDIGRLARIKTELVSAANGLIDELEKMPLSDKDMQYTIVIRENIRSAERKIRNSTYNVEAAAANENIKGFYSKSIVYVRNIKQLHVFQ